MHVFSFFGYLLIATTLSGCMSKSSQAQTVQQSDEHQITFYYDQSNCFNTVKRCNLDIVKLIDNDTLIYVSSSEDFGRYEEFHGKLTRINDSIYHVRCFRHVQAVGNGEKPFQIEKDTLFFRCDSALINRTLTIEYSNRQQENHTILSTRNAFPIRESLFRSEKDRLLLSFAYPHPIVDEIVELRVSYYSNAGFKTDYSCADFYILVNADKISTLNPVTSRNGSPAGPHFSLERFTEKDALFRGRKIR